MDKNYEFREYSGCISAAQLINDKNFDEYSQQEGKEILNAVLDKIKKEIDEGFLSIFDLINLIEPDENIWGEICEQCGDSTNEKIWNL